MTKTTPQNTAFSPLFAKKRKDRFCNKLNISALHFCILHFIPPQCLDSGNLLLFFIGHQ